MLASPILIVGRDRSCREIAIQRLRSRGIQVREVSDRSHVQPALSDPPALVIVGCGKMDPWSDIELARQVREADARVAMMLVVVESSEELAIAALRLGVKEYLKPPFDGDVLAEAVDRCLGVTKHHVARKEQSPAHNETPLIGDCKLMRDLRGRLLKIAGTDVNVLLTGATGTGKELAAQMIHRNSRRSGNPLVYINCAAIPSALLETELFGHEKGAFTGAFAMREGKLSYAKGGTVLLDEIGDMKLSAQARILRAIESRQIERIGGNRPIHLDVRIIAATSHNLEKMVSENRFRPDLYYRLNIARVELPNLRDRKEDLDCLFRYYFHELGQRFDKDLEGFSAEVAAALANYEWPGNVRELRNLVESLMVTCSSRTATMRDLPENFQRVLLGQTRKPVSEKSKILKALTSCQWNKSKAADQLHWSRMTLYRKMKLHNITGKGERQDVTESDSLSYI